MTLKTSSRIAGATLLLYIIIGVTQMIVGGRAARGATTAARLASMATHAAEVRISVLLGLLTCFIAIALACALYAITRDEDRDLALLALALRVGEGVIGAMFLPMTLALLASPPDAPLADFIFAARRVNPLIAATLFAGGSAIFSWLMLRGRMIPIALAWLGVIASVLLLVALPLQLANVLPGSIAQLMWIPMAAFEIPLGVWLIVKGVSASRAPHPIPR